MPGAGESLFWIALCAVLAPLLAGLVLRHKVPEVVILLVLGMVIGPHVLELAVAGEGVSMLRELGLGMLFLLAGYELEPAELAGRGGRRALVTWTGCLLFALVLVFALHLSNQIEGEFAVAIALTSTALGTLLPILKDGGLIGTKVGRSLLNHGAYGELGPIVAMAVLLGVRGPLESLVVLVAFGGLAVAMNVSSRRFGREGSSVLEVVRRGAETSGQTEVRLVVLLLISLLAAAAVFELDAVLGAFAAGFVLRQLVPGGHESLEHKLVGLAFGLLIPVFFITSGMAIDPMAVVEAPVALAFFVGLILVVRGGGVLVASLTEGEFTRRESAAIAAFASAGLPIIVAVTTIAERNGAMTATNASVMVAGGALTVLICPLLGQRLLTGGHPDRVSRSSPEAT